MTTVVAVAVTPAARTWMAVTTRARVLNVFERACNLINQDGAILGLVTSERGLNPFAVVLAPDGAAPFHGISTASPVAAGGDRLRVGRLQVRLAAAASWDPRPDWPAVRQTLAASPWCLDQLRAITAQSALTGSLLDLYSPQPGAPIHLATAGTGSRGLSHAFLDRARRGATALVDGLASGALSLCVQGAQTLAGLGPGLTPAGDDFLVGVILAIWSGLYGPRRSDLPTSLAEAAAPLTTTLSAAYLRAAGRGECLAAWHALFAAWLDGDAEAARAAIRSLMSIGHTSGADMLAGFLAGGIRGQ